MNELRLVTFIILSLSTSKNSVSPRPNNVWQFTDTCKTGIDTLTGRRIYLTAEIEPECEGGKVALLRRINKGITFPERALTNDIQSTYLVGFIVEIDGHVSGVRIIKGKTNQVGRQLIKIIKSCRWHPATCNGKKVAMLYKIPVILHFGID
jgi:TonB family protein